MTGRRKQQPPPVFLPGESHEWRSLVGYSPRGRKESDMTEQLHFTNDRKKAMAPHSSTLAWKIPWTEDLGRLQSMGSLGVRHNWVTSLSLFTFHSLEKELATHSNILGWRIPWTGEPGGLPSMGSRRVGHDWSDLAGAAAAMTGKTDTNNPVLKLDRTK